MGTLRCRYPSPWVPLLACHAASGWRTSLACTPGTAWQGGQGGHRALCGDPLSQGCSECWWCPGLEVPCMSTSPRQGLVHPWGLQAGDGAGGWVQAPRESCGKAPAPAAVLPAHPHDEPALPVLPRPRHHGASSSFPSYFRRLNPAVPTGHSRRGACTHLALGACQGAGSVLAAGAMEPVAQGAAELAACRAEAPTGSARPWLPASCRQGDPGQESGTTNLRCTRDSGPHPCASTAPCCCPHSHCAPQLPWPHIPIPVGPLPCVPPPDPTAP